jgi:hypothetical protein
MTAHVRRPRGTSVEINRVAKISARDLLDTDPDTLTELKRAVDTLDLLEVSDNAAWVTRVATLPAGLRGLFARGIYDRLRYRHYIYGQDTAAHQRALVAVLAAGNVITAWYRLAASTAVAGEWESVTEVLGGTPLTQVAAIRKPAEAASANGLPIATFDNTDVWVQTLESGTNGTTQWWIAFRVKPVDFGSTQMIVGSTSAAGTAPNKLSVNMESITGKLVFTVFSSAFNGRVYTSTNALTAGVWNHGYILFDGLRTAEFDPDGLTADAKVRMFIGTVASPITAIDTGTGGAVSALLASVGTAAIGAANNVDAPAGPLRNGTQLGPNFFCGKAPLTTAQLAAMVAFEVPT